jgi:hypothetical protein
MRGSCVAVLLALVVTCSVSRTALAQEEPVPPRPKRDGGGSALLITGSVFVGVGSLSIMASGIAWTVAAAEASKLDSECSGKVCVEGTAGAESLDTARDAKSASIVLFAIGLPVTTAGFVLMLYSGGLSERRRSVSVAPTVGPGGGGARLRMSF